MATATKTPKLELVDIDGIEAHPENPNQGDTGAIVDLIVHNGWFGQTLVQTRDGPPARIFVGEHRWRALRLLQSQGGVVRENGSETTLDYPALQARAEALDLPALPPPGKCWVQRYAISDRLARRHMLADNRAHDLASYDDQQLAAILREIADEDGLVGTGFDAEALDELLRDLAADEAKNRPRVSDEAPERPENPVTKLGDLIVLGEHRLLCGDCRDPESFARLLDDRAISLLLTDPPYGINAVGSNGRVGGHVGTMAPRFVGRPIVGDDAPFDPSHLLAVDCPHILWGANHYADKLPPGSRWLVWDKKDGAFEGSGMGDAELAWSDLGGSVRMLHHTWQGMYRKGEGERSPRVHPTQKPVDLMEWCMGQANEVVTVLDPYAGSGSTLIAADRSNRTALLIEIDPGYCDVIVARYEKHTGQQAQRL